MRVRHCAACRTDYRPDITVCADCGGALEDRDDELDQSEPSGPAPASAAVDDALEGFEPAHTSRDLDELPPLADALLAAGVDCRIRPVHSGSHVTGYRLLVHSADRAAAGTVLRPLLQQADESGFDDERGYARCPACDSALAPKSLQCPECGLLLGEAQLTCHACGAPVDADARRCGECGAAVAASD